MNTKDYYNVEAHNSEISAQSPARWRCMLAGTSSRHEGFVPDFNKALWLSRLSPGSLDFTLKEIKTKHQTAGLNVFGPCWVAAFFILRWTWLLAPM